MGVLGMLAIRPSCTAGQYVAYEQIWFPSYYLINTATPGKAFRPDLKWDICIIRLNVKASELPAIRGKRSFWIALKCPPV